MDHPFIAFAGGSRLVGVDSGNDDAFVLDFFLDRDKPCEVIHNGDFVVCGARADDD